MIAERGVGMLLVEHDMDLVRTVCDHVYVMDFGTLIFEGSPAEMDVSATVRAAYLGADLLTAEADASASPTTGSAVPI
jgi:ABC-type branched-subunit amino acid transport system ATPase component